MHKTDTEEVFNVGETLNAEELLEDIKRVKLSMSIRHGRMKKRFQSCSDFIRRKYSYRCVFCHKSFAKKPTMLHTSLEPHHVLKRNETIEKVMRHYQIDEKKLLELNPEYNDLEEFIPGSLFRVPPNFRIYFNTHGICYCFKCKTKRYQQKMDYVSYCYQLYEQRRNIRAQVTPALRRSVFKRDQYKCVYCEIEFGSTRPGTYLTLDHKKPVASGGLSTESNLCTSCSFHNFEKGKDTYEHYIQHIKKRRNKREISLEVSFFKKRTTK